MNQSWFSKTSDSKYGLLPNDSRHELPRWRSPSPMAASIIPPPIVQSTYATSSPEVTPKSVIIEKQFSPLQDRQSELEADLQFLLDAQAEGLLRGLEGSGLQNDQGSTGSTTPTAHSERSVSARRSAKPVRSKPGLKSARKGIYNSILALSVVKDQELQTLDAEVRDKEEALAQIDEWEQKRLGLQEASRHVDDGEETIRVQRLRQEADVLQEEINVVELQLSDMKARHRKLLKQVAAVENSVQAKLASYTSSLSMLEADVQRFLSLKPPGEAERPLLRDGGRTSMWQLPPKRRTLEMAREQWSEDREAVSQQRQVVEHEKTALDEGAKMWKEVVARVTEFEKALRDEMSAMSNMSSSHSAWEDPPPPSQAQETPLERLKQLLKHLDTVLQDLDDKFDIAQQKDWKLLIAAIGAEVDALRQGRQILEGVLGVSNDDGHQEELVDAKPPHAQVENGGRDNGDEIHGLDKRFETGRPAVRRMMSDTEDDPDPELMFSKQDVEHE